MWVSTGLVVQNHDIQTLNFGSKEFAIIPDILGEQNRPIYQAWLSGEDETVITVDIACEVIRQVVMQENKTGIHHSE